LYAEAFSRCGYMGEVYELPRHLFTEAIEEWADRRGVLVKAIEDAALGMASVFRGVGIPLPNRMPLARDHVLRKFGELLARFMPFDLVIDEETADGHEARVSKTSVAGSWGAIAGELRYFADRSGNSRAGIEGTQVPMQLIRKYSTRGVPEIVYDPKRKGGQLLIQRTLEYFGFELERETEVVEDITPELAPRAIRALAEALARGHARHPAVKRNRAAIEEIRQAYRRSGGETSRLKLEDLAGWYERQLAGLTSMNDFRNARMTLDRNEFVPREVREKFAQLPDSVAIRDRDVDIEYDVEEDQGRLLAVARLRLPEKLARGLSEAELPVLDRPLRFVVIRGQRGALRADSLEELQELLSRPWSPDEIDDNDALKDHASPAERHAHELARHARHSSERGSKRKSPGSGRGRSPRRKFRGR
ncbi:MAG: DEAD/DEAH box helicase, partial [Thermoanaerobaculia bacterium]